MKTRALTESEKSDLLKIYANSPPVSPKEALFFCGVSLVLSIPFSIIFFLVALFANHEPMVTAISAGAAALVIGPGVLALIAIRMLFSPKPFSAIREEIAHGSCSIKTYKLICCFYLVDEGNVNEPDVLAKIEGEKVIAIPCHQLSQKGPVKSVISISYLPASKIDIGATFSGDAMVIHEAITTDNLWRNDNLPYLKPIPFKKLPEELVAILNRYQNRR